MDAKLVFSTKPIKNTKFCGVLPVLLFALKCNPFLGFFLTLFALLSLQLIFPASLALTPSAGNHGLPSFGQ